MHNAKLLLQCNGENMSPVRKLWLLILVCGCILMLQYHVASSWTATRPAIPSSSLSSSEALVNAAVSRVQLDSGMAHFIGEKFLRELTTQIAKELYLTGGCDLTVASENWPEKPIYIITPTYRRPEQLAELTRLANTLMHVRNIVWLVIEDATQLSPLVSKLLDRTGIRYYHLIAPMPEEYKVKKVKPRGVSNRNRGLEWIRENASVGVLYFADDDNTYDIRLFDEIRTTNKVSMFPVGLCTKTGVSTPVVHNGTFIGFYDGWIGGRKFPVDMAGFAVNVQFLLKRPNAVMPYKPGLEEDGFLRSLAPFDPKEMELKAENCTQILVWHTQTKKNEPSAPLNLTKYNNTNLIKLKMILV